MTPSTWTPWESVITTNDPSEPNIIPSYWTSWDLATTTTGSENYEWYVINQGQLIPAVITSSS